MKTNWIKFEEQTPEKGRLFIARKIGKELGTGWKLPVWNKETFTTYCGIHNSNMLMAEYLYID